MEILQRSIRKMKRSEDEYIAIFKDYIAYARLTGEKITKTNFGRWSYQKFGSNIECALRRKFKKKNGKSGFSEIMEICGVPVKKKVYTDDELLEFLDKVYTFSGRKYMPGQSQAYKYRNSLNEIEKSNSPYPDLIKKRFKGLANAWDCYFRKYKIIASVHPATAKHLGRKQGFEYNYLKQYNMRRSPINEQGVVFFFATIENIYIQEAFPDCIAIYSKNKEKTEREVNIEFKYSLLNFFHSVREDFKAEKESRWVNIHFVICWENNLNISMAERYKLLEERFGERAINLKRHIFGINFIFLKEYLEKKHPL